MPQKPESEDLSIYEVALALILPTVSITAVEVLIHLVTQRMLRLTDIANFTIVHGHWLLLPAIGFVTWSIGRRGKNGILAAASGIAIAFFIVFRFRGSMIWPGTFDLYARDPRPWYLMAGLGYLIGTVLALRLPRKPRPETFGWAWLPFTGIVVLGAWLDGRAGIVPSFFAPSRHIALTVLLCLALCALAAERLTGRFAHEKSLQSY